MEFKTIIAYIVYEITKAVAALWKGVRERKEEMQAKDNFTKISAVLAQIDHICSMTPACRALIIKTSNGGGQTNARSPMYASCLFESTSDGVERHYDRFTNIPVDGHFMGMVSDAIKDGRKFLNGKDLPACNVKSMMTVDGCDSMTVQVIRHTSKEQFLLLVQFPPNTSFISPTDDFSLIKSAAVLSESFK